MCYLVQCQTPVVCFNREVITFLFFRIDAIEMKKEGKYCIWDRYNSVYLKDDLKSITVSL